MASSSSSSSTSQTAGTYGHNLSVYDVAASLTNLPTRVTRKDGRLWLSPFSDSPHSSQLPRTGRACSTKSFRDLFPGQSLTFNTRPPLGRGAGGNEVVAATREVFLRSYSSQTPIDQQQFPSLGSRSVVAVCAQYQPTRTDGSINNQKTFTRQGSLEASCPKNSNPNESSIYIPSGVDIDKVCSTIEQYPTLTNVKIGEKTGVRPQYIGMVRKKYFTHKSSKEVNEEKRKQVLEALRNARGRYQYLGTETNQDIADKLRCSYSFVANIASRNGYR